MHHHFWARHAPIQHRSRGKLATAAPTTKLLSATQHLPASSMVVDCQAPAKCPIRCKDPLCPRNRCTTISGRDMRRYSIAHSVIQRPRHSTHAALAQRLPASRHDAEAQSCRTVPRALQAPQLPPKQVRCIFCRPPTQRRPRLQISGRGTSPHAALTAFESTRARCAFAGAAVRFCAHPTRATKTRAPETFTPLGTHSVRPKRQQQQQQQQQQQRRRRSPRSRLRAPVHDAGPCPHAAACCCPCWLHKPHPPRGQARRLHRSP